MRRVFVSYSRNNLEPVTQLIQDLQAVGIDAWHDQTLTGGQRWWDSILTSIRECDIFIFALSPESCDSEACQSELNYVVQLGKPILPVLVSDGVNLNLLSPPLNEIQVTDYRRRDKSAAFALVKSIYTAPPTTPLPDPLPTPPCVPVSYLSTLKERIDAPEQLSSQEQIMLLFELETELREGRSPTEVRDLLLRLKRRDDVLAKVTAKIDEALERLEDKAPPVQPRGNVAPEPPVPAFTYQNIEADDYQRAAESRLCPQCNRQVKAGLRFCVYCGVALWESGELQAPAPTTALVKEENVAEAEPANCRRYICTPDETPRLIADVKGWLDAQNFDSQEVNTENQNLLLQIKKRGGWRRYFGMATSLNILFRQSGDTLTVEIGGGKWIDKYTATDVVGQYFLWPLAGYGAWEQMKMPEKVFDYIASRLVYK